MTGEQSLHDWKKDEGHTSHRDFANDLQDEVLGQQVGRHFAIQDEPHGGWHLDEQLASAHNEASIGVANACCKLAKRASIAGVGVCSKQNLACSQEQKW